jgi:flagellar hook-basal body complex protein FliE
VHVINIARSCKAKEKLERRSNSDRKFSTIGNVTAALAAAGNLNESQQGETMQLMMSAISAAVPALTSMGGAGATLGGTPSAGQPTQAAPFSDLLTDAVGQVNKLEDQATTAVTGLMSGTGVDVHQAMIATQKASMAFELSLAVRNKAVQAYQSVIGMQF